KRLLELGEFRGDDELAVWRPAVALEIFLVIALGGIEGHCVGNFGDDGVGPALLRRQLLDDRLRVLALLGGLAEDHGPVLRPDVVALAVLGRRVVNGEENPEQVAKAELGRVEGYAHHLGMSGPSAADVLVSRVGAMPAGVAGLDRVHAAQAVEYRFKAPETTAAEHGDLGRGGGGRHGGFPYQAATEPEHSAVW